MPDSKSFQLRFGPYSTPQFNYGDVVADEVRGEVTIVGLIDTRIPWPIGKRPKGQKTLIVYAGLADAIRKEANAAVCHWWGVTPQTVSKWRNALKVGPLTQGTRALLRDCFTPQRQDVMRTKREPKYQDPERNEKIRQSKLGKPRPKHVVEALREAHLGSQWSEHTRQRVREARKKRHPRSYAPWTAEEDELVRTLTIERVVALTGRSHGVVERRRAELGVSKSRNRKN